MPVVGSPSGVRWASTNSIRVSTPRPSPFEPGTLRKSSFRASMAERIWASLMFSSTPIGEPRWMTWTTVGMV